MPNLSETLKLINDFQQLPKGWNFGLGVPASAIAVTKACSFLAFAFGLDITDFEAFPGNDGEVQICSYLDDNTLEVTFEIDGSAAVVFEKDDNPVFRKQGISFTEVIKILRDFRFNQCRSYVSSISASTTVQESADSQVWLLDPHLPVATLPAAYPSLTKSAPRRRVHHYVPTSQNTTRVWLGLQLSSGKFQIT